MSAANTQHRCPRRANEARKVVENLWLVIIKVAQRAAQHDCVGTKIRDRFGEQADMDNPRDGLLYQTLDVADDVLHRKRSDLALALQMVQSSFSPFFARYLREIAFVAQKIIDDQHSCLIDALFNRLVVTVGSLVEWEGKWLSHLGRVSVVQVGLLNFDGHIRTWPQKGTKSTKVKTNRQTKLEQWALASSSVVLLVPFRGRYAFC